MSRAQKSGNSHAKLRLAVCQFRRIRLAKVLIKRVYEAAAAADGFRVLVDRLWPRGIPKTKAHIDLWLKEIAPTDALQKWFAHDPSRWTQFQVRYRRELRGNHEGVKQLKKVMRDNRTITLLFSARDEQHNNAVVLCSFLRGGR